MSANKDIISSFEIITKNEIKNSINDSLISNQDQLIEDISSPNYNVWFDEEQNRLFRIHKLPSLKEKNSLFKDVVREGIYNPFRPEVYQFLTNSEETSENTSKYWNEIVSSKAQTINERVISSFGFPNYELFMPNESLREILTVIKNQNTQIEFSPMIPSVVAIFLLYFDAPKTYSCVQSMINNGDKYFTNTKKDFTKTLKAIEYIVINLSKKLSDYAQSLKLSISDISMFTIPLFFTKRVNKNVSLTIFDSFVYEGRKALIKYMLGILMILQKHLLKTTSAEEFMAVIIEYLTTLKDPQNLSELTKLTFSLHISKKKKMVHFEKKAQQSGNDIDYKIVSVLPTIEEFGTFRQFSQLTSATAGTLTYMGDRRSARRVSIQQMMKSNSAHNGKLLTGEQYDRLRCKFPAKYRYLDAWPLYLMSVDGASMTKLISKSGNFSPCMIVIKTEAKTIGAVLSDAPNISYHGRYYGSALTSVFDLSDFSVYKGTLKNDYFISVAKTSFCIGGGDGIAIYLSNNFDTILSAPCETFGSPPFFENDQYVKVIDMELYKLSFL